MESVIAEVKRRLRDLRVELALLNNRVGTRVDLSDLELDCLDVLVLHGPLTPSVLARRTGLHLATMTGVLNRLESGGWIERARAEHDRRSVVLKIVPARVRDVFVQYNGMNRALDEILDGFRDAELRVIADFLEKAIDAGRVETERLGGKE